MSHLAKFTIGGAATVPPFDPLTLGSQLKAWYKTPFGGHGDNDNLTTWTDSSGNANTVSFSGGAPTDTLYKTNIRSGQDIVRTSGSTRHGLTASAIDLSAGGSFYWVAQAGFGAADFSMIANSATLDLALYRNNANILTGFYTGFGVYSQAGTWTSEWRIASMNFDTTTLVVGLDGVDGTQTGSATMTLPNSTLEVYALHGPGGTSFWGDIGEILICAPMLSPTNHANIIGYLKGRWGIS